LKTSEQIPLLPQDWCKNPAGYVTHQGFLKRLVEFLEDRGINSLLPPDRDGWDRGVDLFVHGLGNIDVKGFTLIAGPKSYTWDSTFWTGKRRPLYNDSLTDFYIHPFGDDVAEWIVAPASSLNTSFHGFAPFYWSDRCKTVQQVTEKLLTNV
jgi:hypothetical protein